MIRKILIFLIFFIIWSKVVFAQTETDINLDGLFEEPNITESTFTINVNSLSPWMDTQGSNAEENVEFLLWTIIQNLMIALWSIALFIMTIWAWYILLHHWKDELLSKWKDIFISWIYGLIIALSAYYIVAILRYILYN